ncbi:hypothetical protein GCM10008927_00990 [Amylibacter ulvae]|uniref:DUF995 domain-containing protein n=1 Tax=Paramylibacter ulvae TaxID=1651968 RepID=A0ABQ3CRF3_9RHOB|nr:hypothetical protein [Amylibacter ulvae]GHA40578.1 hypothetical protein GCM10008927_00990 [Amylibacter ulvae]
MFRLVLFLAFFANPALAEGWHLLDGKQIKSALTSRTISYGTEQQDFKATGKTLYQTKTDGHWGRWRVRANKYCSQWPPAKAWTCYKIHASTDGRKLRFEDKAGKILEGRYIDLN